MAIEGEIKVLGGAVVVHFANAPAGKYLDRHFISRNERLPNTLISPSIAMRLSPIGLCRTRSYEGYATPPTPESISKNASLRNTLKSLPATSLQTTMP